MPPLQLLLLAGGLSMDAFAVAVTLGLGMGKPSMGKAVTVGAYFGFFQGVMPLAGYFAARGFASYIMIFDTYVVFALLTVLGARMIYGAFKGDGSAPGVVALTPRIMLPFALATSIDALAVGISFAFFSILIVSAVLLIGAVTFILSAAGVKIGGFFGERFKTKAAVAGGVILILIGVKVLAEGLL
jgi:putative Mn2+ efflux pump MntP